MATAHRPDVAPTSTFKVRIRRAVVGAGRRFARVQAGVLRLSMATARATEQQVQATLAVQRVTTEVAFELITAWQAGLVRRLDRWAGASS